MCRHLYRELQHQLLLKQYQLEQLLKILLMYVIEVIAGLAATEVEGVSAMAGNITNDLLKKVGGKSLSKGVKVEVVNGQVTVELAVVMGYGYNIPTTCGKIQEKVKSTIENMTGLTVSNVNIRIAGVDMKNGN